MTSHNNHIRLEHLYGSSRFANLEDGHTAGIFAHQGLYHAMFSHGGPSIRLPIPRDTLIVGNTGCGIKQYTVFEQVLTCPYPMYVSDPDKAIAPVTIGNQASLGKAAHCFGDNDNALTQPPWFIVPEAINPFSVLTPGHPNLVQRIIRFMQCIVDPDNNPDLAQPRDVLDLAIRWGAIITHWRIQSRNSVTSLPDLFSVVKLIASDAAAWDRILESQFRRSSITQFRSLANEMRLLRSRQPEKYLGVLSVLQSALSFLESDGIAQKLGTEAVPVQHIIESRSTFYNLSKHRVLQKVFLMATMFAKQDANIREPMVFILDNRARLGKLELENGDYIDDQPEEIVVEEIWRSLAEIKSVLGDNGMNLKLSRFPVQQYSGLDNYTANAVSKMLGTTTIRYKSSRAKMQDDQLNASIALAIIEDRDPLEEIVRANAQKDTYDYQPRPLKKPEELVNMPLDGEIIFLKHTGCQPINGVRMSYDAKRSLRGKYLPHPRRDPPNRVRYQGRSGKLLEFPIAIGNVPAEWRHLPQYALGYRAVVQCTRGYRSIIKKPLRSLMRNIRFGSN